MIEYHETLKEMKKVHFNSMHYHKSADPALRNQGLMRILEIGAGSGMALSFITPNKSVYNFQSELGANFEFYPANSSLTVVEPNAYFEPLFYERQSKFPAIKMEKFVLGSAEQMTEIKDGSIDVAVSTLVLCSVDSLSATLKEIQRVLAPVTAISINISLNSNYYLTFKHREENSIIGSMFMTLLEVHYVWSKKF